MNQLPGVTVVVKAGDGLSRTNQPELSRGIVSGYLPFGTVTEVSDKNLPPALFVQSFRLNPDSPIV